MANPTTTLGAVVEYIDTALGATPSSPFVAIVAKVISNDVVNLSVADDSGNTAGQQTVPNKDSVDSNANRYWQWPGQS